MMKSLSVIAVAFVLLACGGESKPADTPTPPSSASASAGTCTDKDGKTHATGEKWSDGCNECSCSPTGTIGCTRRACEKP